MSRTMRIQFEPVLAPPSDNVRLVRMPFLERTRYEHSLRDVKECLGYFLGNEAYVQSREFHPIGKPVTETLHVHVKGNVKMEVPTRYMGRDVYLYVHETTDDLVMDLRVSL